MKQKCIYQILEVIEKEVRESVRGKKGWRKLAQASQCYLGLSQFC